MKSYSLAADVIRVLAILGVVSIHVLISVYLRPDFQGGFTWWLTNIWNAISRPAIPLFILLSGCLLLSRSESKPETTKRILRRLLIPLVCWALFYSFWNNGNWSWMHLSPIYLVTAIIQSNVGMLYFLVIMVGLYTFLPYFRKNFMQLTNKGQIKVGLVALLTGMLLVATEYYTGRFFLTNFFMLWIPYLGFFLLGYTLSRLRLNRWQIGLCLLGYAIGIIITAFLSYVQLKQVVVGNDLISPRGSLSPYFDFHLSPNVVLMSITLFTLIFQINFHFLQRKILLKMLNAISKSAFGIYLIHLFVIQFLERYFKFEADHSGLPLLPYLIIKFIVVLISSYYLTQLFKHNKWLALTIGETYRSK